MHPHEQGFSDYESLNNSVYKAFNVIPCRNKEDFKKIILVSTGILEPTEITDTELISYFLCSGGVGREIDRGSKRLPSVPDAYYSDPLFRSIVDSMVLRVNDILNHSESWDPWVTSHAISKSNCIEAAKKLVTSTDTSNIDAAATKALDELFDNSLLLDIEGSVELLQPGIVEVVRKDRESNRFENMAFEGILVGLSDNSNNPYPSPGHLNEEPIRRMLSKIESKPYHSLVEMRNKQVLSSAEHLNVWYQGVATFTGIDGFLIEENTDDNKLDVSTSQIKTGKLGSQTKLGTISSKNTFRYFLNGMETGFKKLKQIFNEEDRKRLRLKRFVFLTTKDLEPACIEYINNPDNFRIDDQRYEFQLYDSDYILENIALDSIVINRLRARRQL